MSAAPGAAKGAAAVPESGDLAEARPANADAAEEALVVFTPSGRRGKFPKGTRLLQAARALGVDVDSVCGGRGICGRCQITLSEGEFAKHGVSSHQDHLSPFGDVEERYHRVRGLAPGRRLSCSTELLGDVIIDVPPDSQVHKQIVRKRAEVRAVSIDPVVSLHYVEVREPDMHDPSSDLRRLCMALREQWDLTIDDVDVEVLHRLQRALRAGEWWVTAAVRNGDTLIGIWPGLQDKAYGLAIDVGSTTIAAHLCDLSSGEVIASSGVMNPQIRFGEDLMSRVSYIMMNPGGDRDMTEVVRRAIDDLAKATADEAGIGTDDILEATIVGNPIMHHLVLGIDPVELGGAPFALTVDEGVTLRNGDLDLHLHSGARVFALPCIAGHVGADTAGVILSEAPHKSDDLMLLVDVGTNAEIVLGNKDRLLACSSPTGPAFEGAQISGGQRAAPGAIERVRIDPETLEPKFRVIGSDVWSTDAGFAEATAQSGVTGICGSGIIEAIAEMYLAGIITRDGVIDGGMAERSDRIRADGRTFSYALHEGDVSVIVTQNDVRAIQLAKAALYAGVKLLMDRLEVEAVDRIVLAGAFGSHIDVKYAMVLGLIPDCDLTKVSSAGNAAGTGARIALLNRAARAEIQQVVRQVEKIETAVEPKFQEHFVNAMGIPNSVHAFPKLAAAVTLPPSYHAALESGGAGEPRRRRRRRE